MVEGSCMAHMVGRRVGWENMGYGVPNTRHACHSSSEGTLNGEGPCHCLLTLGTAGEIGSGKVLMEDSRTIILENTHQWFGR